MSKAFKTYSLQAKALLLCSPQRAGFGLLFDAFFTPQMPPQLLHINTQ